jgi:hypothetical protein
VPSLRLLHLAVLLAAGGAYAQGAASPPPAPFAPDPGALAPDAEEWHSTATSAPAALPGGRGPLFHPDGPGRFKWRYAVGLQMDLLPRRVVQSEQREIPQITAQVRFGLPAGFSADARAAAIVINNQVELGVAWGAHEGPLAVSLHDHQGFWFGLIGAQGFDASGWGWINKPGITIGVELGRVRFSLTGEFIYLFGQHVRLGADNIARGAIVMAGESFTLAVENLLDSGGLWYFGLGVLRTSPNYQAWLAFSDERSRLPYPRFFGGYAF